jgi:hypothetical protein
MLNTSSVLQRTLQDDRHVARQGQANGVVFTLVR